MAFELSLGMGGIFTGRDVEGYSVPGMAGAEEEEQDTSPLPASLPTLGGRKEPGAQGREVVS